MPGACPGAHATGAPTGTVPYDRILVTVGIRRVPTAWIEQTRPGGVILAPWGTTYGNADAVVRLEVGRGRPPDRSPGSWSS